MNYTRLAGVGFLIAGLVSLFRFGIDPAATTPDIFNAVMGVGLCSLGFLWLRGDVETGTETAHNGRRITVSIAAIAAIASFIGGVMLYVVV